MSHWMRTIPTMTRPAWGAGWVYGPVLESSVYDGGAVATAPHWP